MYLNEIYFGNGAYGVKAAARRYFGKEIQDITLSESATLAGIPRQHNYYNPIANYTASLERRNLILKIMLDSRIIDQQEYNFAKEESLIVNPSYLLSGKAPYFVEEVRKWLINQYGINRIYQSNGGLDVYTTLDYNVQIVAESLLENGLVEIEDRFNLNPKRNEIEAITEDGKTRYIQGALVSMLTGTGEIISLVGGRNFTESEFNRATQSRRQVGSSFKPFVYLSVLDNGFTLGDIMLDAPLVIDLGGGNYYKPQNYDHKYEGFLTLRMALAKSRNTIAVKLLRHIGVNTVISYARLLGIKSPMSPVLSLALGSCGITPMEMVGAYGVFSSGGIRVDPYLIKKIEERKGNEKNIIFEYNIHPTRVISKETAYLMQSMMSSVVKGGTATGAARRGNLTRPAAAKTGTTDDYTDAWLVGYTPDIVCAVWVGFDSTRTIARGATGGGVAGPIWAKYIVEASRILEISVNSFPVPDNITSVLICSETGEIASDNCPEKYNEVYIVGTQPNKKCQLHSIELGLPLDSIFRDDNINF